MIFNVSLDLPRDGSYLRIARLLGRTLLEYLKVVPNDVADTELVVGELCTNVIRHSQDAEGRFLVLLEYHADRVVVTVEDKGVGFSFKEVLPVGATRPDTGGGERIGGFGLQLVQMLSDRLEFRRSDPHGTTVRAEKRLHYQTPERAEAAAALDGANGGNISISRD